MTALLRSLPLLCALLAFSLPVLGADENTAPPAPVVNIRAGIHADYDRLVVDWPRHVGYTIHRDGAHVTVDFRAPGQAGWQDVILTGPKRVSGFLSSTAQDGNLSISFNVDPKATIKDFISGNSVAIDISGGEAPPKTAQEAATPSPKPEPPPKPEQKPDEKPPEKTAAVVSPAPPPAPTPPPAAPPPPPSIAAPPAAAPSAPVTTSSSAPAPVAIKTLAPAATPAPAAATPPPVTTPSPPSAATPAKQSAFSLPEITTTPLLVASLDAHAPLRAAVYQRGGYGYIIFDKKLMLDLAALTAGQPAMRIQLEPIELPKASGYRLPVPPNVEIRAARNGNVWQIFLTRQQPEIPVSVSLVPQPDFALGARLLLPLTNPPEPVRLTDPVVGDDVIIVPMEQTQAFSVGRHMADFDILPAAQGLVIRPLIDKLIVRAVTDGIEITAEGGLRLSSSNDTGNSQQSAEKAKAAAAGKSMFDFAGWRGKPEETFTLTRQRLQQTIVDVPEEERDRARLELARFYFANGDGEEAVALLEYLKKLVPDISAHTDFRALEGAGKILAWRPDEGLKDFDTTALAEQPEIELWQAVAYAEMRNWKEAEEKFSITESLLNGYPEPFYSRFTIFAIEAALAQGKDQEAGDWLDRLESGRHSDSSEVAMEYLRGILDAKSGHAQKAEEAWKAVAASNDNLYRVRAKLALVDLGVSTGSLTPAQAADQLEALRFAWRGDDLELDILHRLGEFYVQAHNVKAGLNTMARATQLYPNSSLTPGIHDEMATIFRDLFLKDGGKNLAPLDALMLYQEYRNLMPTGADGIAVMRNLAEQLVQIDLLDQAADILESLAKDKLQGEDKSRVATRLAAIRLLNHQPERAIDALDMSNLASLPADLQSQRILLRARALSEMKKYDDALALIKDNNSQAARLLRADITMHAQRWGDASEALLNLIGPPPPAGTPLTPEQATWLVNCAIAASMAGDTAGVDKLHEDYSAAIASLPQNDTFLMLTEPEKSDQSKDIAAAQAKIADVDMFQGFLDTYRKDRDIGISTDATDTTQVPTPQSLPASAPAATASPAASAAKP